MDHSIRSHRGISPQLGQRVYIDPAATVIGDVSLGDDASVWPGAVIRGDMHRIVVGARSNVQDNAVLHITHASDFNPDGWPLTIGDDVVIGHRATAYWWAMAPSLMMALWLRTRSLLARAAWCPPAKLWKLAMCMWEIPANRCGLCPRVRRAFSPIRQPITSSLKTSTC